MLNYSLSTTEETVYSLANKITALVKKKKTLVEFLQLDSTNSNLVISSSSVVILKSKPFYLGLSSVFHYQIFLTRVIQMGLVSSEN